MSGEGAGRVGASLPATRREMVSDTVSFGWWIGTLIILALVGLLYYLV